LVSVEENVHEAGLQEEMRKENTYSADLGERAGSVLFSQWNGFCGLRENVLRQADVDSVHDLRVASRRMRATIGLFAPFIAGKAVRRISKALRRVTRELGRLRNIDEAVIYFGALPEPLPVLNGLLPAVREQELKAVMDVLKPFPLQLMDRMLREAVAELVRIPHEDQDLPAYLSETSIQRYQAVYDLLLPATIPESVETRHALRIAIKKWRYLLETLGQVCQHDYSAMLETLKEYQTLLGSLNDMVEFGALCDTLILPVHEIEGIKAALARNSAAYLARFIETAATRPLQYTFSL
jgi:CHAD domain-containing protein